MAMIPYYCRSIARRPESDFWNDNFFWRALGNHEPWAEAFRVDVRDEGDHFLVEAELPGCTRNQIHVDVDDGVLTIGCETTEENAAARGAYVYNERRSGNVQRSFTLTQIDEDAITADYKDGVLRLILPKIHEEGKTNRRIEIQ